MRMVKDKQILMAADFAGYPLKEAIKEYLEKKGWTVTDIGVKADSDPNDTELMFHRIGLRVGSMITESLVSTPFASASSIIAFAILSLTEPAGLKYSSLAISFALSPSSFSM